MKVRYDMNRAIHILVTVIVCFAFSCAYAKNYTAFAIAGIDLERKSLESAKVGDVINTKFYIDPTVDLKEIVFEIIKTENVNLKNSEKKIFYNIKKGESVAIDLEITVTKVPASMTVQYTTSTQDTSGWGQYTYTFGSIP
jgi:hypothetical protein